MNAARNGRSAQKPADADEEPGAAAKALSNILERGARVQAPAVEAYVQRLRRANPDASPAEIITKLEKRYLAAVMASGAAVGSAAAFPGIGTIAALSAVAGETVVFLEATALFVLAVAEVHGIPAGHREHRRALVLSVLVGDDSKGAVRDLVGPGRTNGAWLGESTAALPLPVVSQLNNRLLKYFVKRYALQAGRDRVRQDAADGHRRGDRRWWQPLDGQEDHQQRPHSFWAAAAAGGRWRCTCCPRRARARRGNQPPRFPERAYC